ncbi:MAG: beta-mannosidase, partial [Oscillospiraceae bacterium]|nr:beta-mannosidase [Oscillospiraceae bacterium]
GDIVGFDKYNTEYNRHDGKQSGEPNEDAESKIFWSLLGYVDNKKMVSMPENDSIPSVENMLIEEAKWLYFCTWYDSQGSEFISGEKYQNKETLKNTYQSEYCITLDELPADLFKSGDTTPEPTTEPTSEPDISGTDDTTAPTGNPDNTILWGDADLNGEVAIGDVVFVTRTVLGKDNTITEQGEKNCDIDEDNKLTPADALNVMRLVVNLISQKDCPIKQQ